MAFLRTSYMGVAETHAGDTALSFLVDAAGQLEAAPGTVRQQSEDWGRRTEPGLPKRGPKAMGDLVFVAATVVFFLVAVAYVSGCERLKGGRGDA